MARYQINCNERRSHINKNIYGQFSEHLGRMIYDGIWVGKNSPIPNVGGVRKDVIDALKQIRVPILRWPGGCFADTYHWQDGIGPARKNIVNRAWGNVVEDNSFGTHEFMNMCEEIGCGAYLSGNLGTGTIREMVEWVEYCTDDVDSPMAQLRRRNGREKPWKIEAFGIGNEVWGCGGQMTPEYYAGQYRQAAHFIRCVQSGDISVGEDPDRMQIIASGPNGDDYDFTEKFLNGIAGGFNLNAAMNGFMTDGMSCHYYSFPDFRKVIGKAMAEGKLASNPLALLPPANEFDEYDWYYMLNRAARIEEIIMKHDEIMSRFDPEKKIGLMVDEWGAWNGVEPGTNPSFLFQQNTMRDAVLAALSLNIFNKHSDRVHLTTIAQMVNVLQAVIMTEGERMVRTPTYYVYDLYKEHQNATLLQSEIERRTIGGEDYLLTNLYESCSVSESGDVLCTICNTSLDTGESIEAVVNGMAVRSAKARILTGDPHACNTFDDPDRIGIRPWSVQVTEIGFSCEVPAGSVVSITLHE